MTRRLFLIVVFCVWLGVRTGLAGEVTGAAAFVAVDTSRLMGSPDPLPPLEIEKAFPNLRFERPVELTHAGDGSGRVFVVTQRGVIYVFPNRADATEKDRTVFLDWTHIVHIDSNEEGLLGLAFHPKYRENGQFFVYYTKRPLQSVVARFRVSRADPNRADRDSFEVLLNFPQPYSNHKGGSLAFGPDGMLYLGLGDGGAGGDPHRNGQNLGTLLGKILRLDVDHQDPGLKYAIPKDNPFAGRKDARGEIWAYGVRNIWRLSFDRLTGALWVGDVGQDLWEEIDIIVRGGNYGWNLREGKHPFRPNLAKGDEKLIEPIWEYGHSVGKCIIGGLVYRGKKFPELYGAYLYSDFETSYLWALRYDGEKVTRNLEIVRPTKLAISSFGEDEDGEARFTAFDGFVYRFRQAQKAAAQEPQFPRKLSDTGLFVSTAGLRPQAGLIPYSVNVPLWSDGAAKDRYIALPKAGAVRFDEQAAWDWPVGTVFIKTFSLPAARGGLRRLETRLLVLSGRGWDGYTYLWNDEQTDAELLDAAVTKPFTVPHPAGERVQQWYFPSRADCLACHNSAAQFTLGLRTRQLNRPQRYGTETANQLEHLTKLGIFAEAPPANSARLEQYPQWPEQVAGSPPPPASMTALARAYLDANCALCHTPGGPSNTGVDLRFHTPLEQTGLLNAAPAKGRLGPAEATLLTPGKPELSELYLRLKVRGESQMPPFASNLVDEQARGLIEAWITSLGKGR